jgi:anionic cell wall polymer biosynthesis LytR-Cps2A-Psr (LCP) family protein
MRMYYPPEDINLRKGYRRLDGQDALSYVRFRSDGKGDLPRIERQHKFMKALADEVLQPGTILKLPDIMKELRNNVKTDLSARDVVVLAGEFRNVSSQNIGFCNLPGSPQYINGASYYVVDEEGLEVLLDEILNGKTESGSTEDQAIHAEEINADVQPERE